MDPATTWCVRLACLMVFLWMGWSLASQTVITLLQQQTQISSLQQQLQHATPAVATK